jgi:hypothetical protein
VARRLGEEFQRRLGSPEREARGGDSAARRGELTGRDLKTKEKRT